MKNWVDFIRNVAVRQFWLNDQILCIRKSFPITFLCWCCHMAESSWPTVKTRSSIRVDTVRNKAETTRWIFAAAPVCASKYCESVKTLLHQVYVINYILADMKIHIQNKHDRYLYDRTTVKPLKTGMRKGIRPRSDGVWSGLCRRINR